MMKLAILSLVLLFSGCDMEGAPEIPLAEQSADLGNPVLTGGDTFCRPLEELEAECAAYAPEFPVLQCIAAICASEEVRRRKDLHPL